MADSALNKRVGLADLIEPESFREVIKSFADLYGIGIRVFDLQGSKVADVRVAQRSICQIVHRHSEGRRACAAVVHQLKTLPLDDVRGAGQFIGCFTGLRYAVMPLLHEGDLLGRLIFGPFWPKDGLRPAESLFAVEPNVRRDDVAEVVAELRSASDEGVVKMLLRLKAVIDVILFTSYRAMLTSSMHVESVTSNYRELMEKNQQLAAANDKLTEVDRLKSNFLAVVSHELRTPLTSIIGYAEMLREGMAGPLNDEQKSYVGTIMNKGDNLLEMISSLLDISRIETGRVEITWGDVDIPDLIESALSHVLPQAAKKHIVLHSDIDPELKKTPGDVEKLRQILINLLANAVKFTPEEGQVSISVNRYFGARHHDGNAEPESGAIFAIGEEDFVRFQVSDTGVGISADYHERVFESFFQVDSSSTRAFGGTGLGLAIVKSFVDAHAGDIWLESELGSGTVVTVLIPLHRS